MTGEEMVIAIIAIGSGAAIILTAMTSVFKIVNKWMDRKSGSHNLNEKFFEDYIQFKKQVFQRLDSIEQKSITNTLQVPSREKNQEHLQQPDAEIMKESSRLKNMLGEKK
jgi:hypothetical protein